MGLHQTSAAHMCSGVAVCCVTGLHMAATAVHLLFVYHNTHMSHDCHTAHMSGQRSGPGSVLFNLPSSASAPGQCLDNRQYN